MHQDTLIRRKLFIGIVLAALCLSILPYTAAQPSPAATDKHEIERHIDAYLRVLERGDLDEVRGQYVDDERFAWFTDGEKVYSSRDEVVRGLEQVRQSGIRLTTSTNNIDIIELCDHVLSVRTDFRTEGHTADVDAASFAFSGVITMIIEWDGGTWKIVQGHTSTPGGPPGRD
ncbi:MAG: nuclear transport factor 2 family protein [Phycisphaerales bacterium]